MTPLSDLPWYLAQGLFRVQEMGGIDLADGRPKGFNWGAVFGFIGGVIGLVLAVAAIYYIAKFVRGQTSKNAVAPVEVIGKEQRRRIQDAVDRGEFEAAGDLFAKAGAHDDAAELYVKSRSYLKAAQEYQRIGNRAQAIHFFKQAGEVSTAAGIYAEGGEHMAAAAEYYAARDYGRSAEQYALAGDDRRAAENFERAKKYLKAAKYYEASELPVKAADNYQAHFEMAFATGGNSLEAAEPDRKYALRAADLYREHGQSQKAGRVYQIAGYYAEAAQCLRTTGDYTGAAQMLMKAEKPLMAADLMEEAGDREEAFRMRAKAALEAGDNLTAAKMFRDANDPDRATELFEQVGAFDEAAQLAERRGMQQRAMELYEQAEMWAHAARCAETAQKWDRAAQLFHRASDVDGELRALVAGDSYFRAGQLQFEHRRYDDALATLMRIDSRDAQYGTGLELQGDVLRAQSRFEKAYSKYRAAFGNREVDEASLPLYYKMARSLEDADDLAGALDLYKTIVAVDKNFEDVGLRNKAVRGRLRRGSMPGVGTSSGIFAAQDQKVDNERYEVLEEIARGGMGIVYKARDTVLGRVVAFKVLGDNLRENETAVKYFLREARAAAALSHPNIVTVYDAGEQSNEYYMAMEFVEGTTLKELIRRKGALPEEQVRYIAVHCCRALQYAHSKGLVHRDIKSGNVMITRDKSLKIMDFGLAKFLRDYQKDHTQQVGTPFYMSPEQIIGGDIDHRADLYSLGCTIYECATGTVPFFKGDLGYHHVHTKPPPPRGINPALSKGLEKLILKMLEKEPDERYQSAKEIIEAVTVKERG